VKYISTVTIFSHHSLQHLPPNTAIPTSFRSSSTSVSHSTPLHPSINSMSSASSSPAGQRRRTFKGKSSQGCLTCKNRHVKCDETRPICNNCRRLNRVCVQRDGSSADPRAQASGSNVANPPVPPMGPVAPTTQAGGSSAPVTVNATSAGPSSVIDATGTINGSQMDDSTQDDQDAEVSNPFSRQDINVSQLGTQRQRP